MKPYTLRYTLLILIIGTTITLNAQTPGVGLPVVVPKPVIVEINANPEKQNPEAETKEEAIKQRPEKEATEENKNKVEFDPALPPKKEREYIPIEDGDLHQIYLEEPAESLDYIRYQDGPKLDGELSPDGKRVIIHNHRQKRRVELKVNYKDGSSKEMLKSSCKIDPVIPL